MSTTDSINIDEIKQETMLNFHQQVEELVFEGISYIEAITEVCERNDIDIEDVKSILSPNLLMKLTEEAANLNLIRETTTRLPI